MLRRIAVVSLVLALGTGASARATAAADGRSALPSRIDVRARSVALYGGASPFLVANGGAVARAGSTVVRAGALRYDLAKNRIVASGDVTLTRGTTAVSGAACSLDVATGVATMLRLDGTQPYTMVLHDGDAAVARPSDGAFDVPDVGSQKPFIRGPHAVVVPNATVRFTPAHVLTDVGAAVPVPSYLYSFEANPSFAQQSLPASTFDQPYGLFGTPSSLASLHVTYAQPGGLGFGLDEHLVDRSKSYLVASALRTAGTNQFNLVGFEQLTPTMSQQFTAAHLPGYSAAQYQVTHNEYDSVTSLSLTQSGPQSSADLRVASLSRMLPHLFFYKFSADVGLDRRSGMLPSSTDSRMSLEGLFTTPSLRAPLGTSFTASLDVVRSLYDFPRETGSSVFTTFLSKQLSPPLRLIGEVQFLQLFDRYRTGQAFFYPPLVLTLPDGTLYYGYTAYDGASTQRMYSLGATYAPNADFNLQVSLTHHRDFPQYDGYGNPPYSLGFDVRVRPHGGPALEFGRAYLFDWGGQRFSPTYTFSVAP